jgi:hypothetical protein
MLAYQTDRAGHFVEVIEADESPLEPGKYLLPAGATFVPPPSTWPEDKWPRFNGRAWQLIQKPKLASADNDAVLKLKHFLNNNPDVMELLQGNNGGANV